MDAEAILASRRSLPRPPAAAGRKAESEGGCGVVGLASTAPVEGRHVLEALRRMRNRGNGKGGGVAVAGVDPAFFGVPPEVLADDYLLAVAYLDLAARAEVERSFLEPTFAVDHEVELARSFSVRPEPVEGSTLALEVEPPAER